MAALREVSLDMTRQLRPDISPSDAKQQHLDIQGNRSAVKWTAMELLGRLLWAVSRSFFAWSPRPFWGWRNALLRLFGARIGSHVHIYPSARIAIPWNLSISDRAAVGDGAIIYNLGPILIDADVTVSQFAHLCAGTHDFRRRDFPLIKSTIQIGKGAWICADAFVGPDVTIGAFAIVGARAVVVRDVAPWVIVGGNPARVIGARPQFKGVEGHVHSARSET